MQLSESGKSLIKSFERLGPEYEKTGRIVAYLCPQGVPTIGYGHTRNVTHSDIGVREISIEQAESYLDADVKGSEAYVSGLGVTLNQAQFDALVSMAHNVGTFGGTLVSQLRAGNMKAVAATMKRYIHASNGGPCKGRCGNKTCKLNYFPGLVTRRAAEVKLLMGDTKNEKT